jgi:hypothetical protein
MRGVIEGLHSQFHRVISVEVADADSADQLARELSNGFPAAVINQDGYWHVVVYPVAADNSFVVDALEVVEHCLCSRGASAAVRLHLGRTTYLGETAE